MALFMQILLQMQAQNDSFFEKSAKGLCKFDKICYNRLNINFARVRAGGISHGKKKK
jgi:hypothetical protein